MEGYPRGGGRGNRDSNIFYVQIVNDLYIFAVRESICTARSLVKHFMCLSSTFFYNWSLQAQIIGIWTKTWGLSNRTKNHSSSKESVRASNWLRVWALECHRPTPNNPNLNNWNARSVRPRELTAAAPHARSSRHMAAMQWRRRRGGRARGSRQISV